MSDIELERETYIEQVLDLIPRDVADRDEIAMEIRSVIVERLEAGESLDEILDDLGTPLELAESYLVDIPMESAGIALRIIAKVIDMGIPYALFFVIAVRTLLGNLAGAHFSAFDFLAWGALVGLFILLPVYSEWRWGQTPGKYFLGLRVVTESGARISLGQSALRQLPVWFQFLWIDAIFALFTPLKQRAFEKLSTTRTILNR